MKALPVLALAGGASVALAGPTWTPDHSFGRGQSYVQAYANDGGDSAYDTDPTTTFGTRSAMASFGGNSATGTLDWNANAAFSVFTASADSSHGGSETYLAHTYLTFVANDGGDFDVNIAFDWQGSGQSAIEAYFDIYDHDADVHSGATNTVAFGPVSTSYSGTLVAGHRYVAQFFVKVYGDGNIVGDGDGTGEMTLNIVPLPTTSALAGLGLLGLGVRRRRVSL